MESPDETSKLNLIKFLIKNGEDLEAKDPNGQTPLHTTSANGSVKGMQLLLEARAKVSPRDNQDATPLHLAAYNGELEAVQVLLGAHADIESKARGRTAFGLALMQGHLPVATYLLERRAHVNVE